MSSRKRNFKTSAPRIDIVLPVYNEEKVLAKTVAILREFLGQHCRYNWRIVIADNGSVDGTPVLGRSLAEQFGDVSYVGLPCKGRGRALRATWLSSDADIVSYMDVDLSTDLNCFLPMIETLIRGEADIAIGSRFKRGALVRRGLKREVLSRGYITLIKLFFKCHFTDAQCGFKAATRRAVQALVPLIENQGWFFDAELLLLAEHHNFRIFEVPVHWIDDPDSRVRIFRTVREHFLGLVRMRLALSLGHLSEGLAVLPVDAHA